MSDTDRYPNVNLKTEWAYQEIALAKKEGQTHWCMTSEGSSRPAPIVNRDVFYQLSFVAERLRDEGYEVVLETDGMDHWHTVKWDKPNEPKTKEDS